MNQLIQLKTPTSLFIMVLVLACFAIPQSAQAVVPSPDGGYPGGNTAEGTNALLSLTTGQNITAVGLNSLSSTTTGLNNTAIGSAALRFNTANHNTVVGSAALRFNTIASNNTAVGSDALANNGVGFDNTANGAFALFSNTVGVNNTATGMGALNSNTTGGYNTAAGTFALLYNSTGNSNTAVGADALVNNTTGTFNTALGYLAGNGVTTASHVICIGAAGTNGSDSCYIGNVWQQPGGSQAVYVNADGKLGAQVSSRRFKEEIKPRDQTSEAIHRLRPVSFRYKAEIEPTRPVGFGLIAEEVEKINADLVTHDKEGKPLSVRYDQVNAMLLNEFLKERRTVEKQGKIIAR